MNIACDYEAPMQMLTPGKKCIPEAVKRILSFEHYHVRALCQCLYLYTISHKQNTSKKKLYKQKTDACQVVAEFCLILILVCYIPLSITHCR